MTIRYLLKVEVNDYLCKGLVLAVKYGVNKDKILLLIFTCLSYLFYISYVKLPFIVFNIVNINIAVN